MKLYKCYEIRNREVLEIAQNASEIFQKEYLNNKYLSKIPIFL